jgi:hypothetical protein
MDFYLRAVIDRTFFMRRRHPERSRFSGGARDLGCDASDGPSRESETHATSMTATAISVYNVQGFNFLIIMRRKQCNAKPAQCGKAD